jgi:hypothetical protein
VYPRQNDGQCGRHPIEFLAVAVRQEEAAFFVREQLVKLGREPVAFKPQRLPHFIRDGGDKIIPFGVGQPELVRLEGPRPPHRGINHVSVPLPNGAWRQSLISSRAGVFVSGSPIRPSPRTSENFRERM